MRYVEVRSQSPQNDKECEIEKKEFETFQANFDAYAQISRFAGGV